MGDVVATEYITLDGVFEAPGGGEPGAFEHAGWSFELSRGEDGDQFKLDELRAADAQLLGRITYEGFAQAWPGMRDSTGEFGEKMNAMPKYVVSTTLSDADAAWENSTVIRDDVAGAVRKLKRDVAGDILIYGSGTLVRSLVADGLVDRINLMVFPTVIGSGKRLFTDGLPRANFELGTAKPVGPDGVLVLTYRAKR